MTLKELEQLETEVLTPNQVAPILGCQPYSINIAVRDGKNPFPFPVIKMGSRVRIPKRPFINAMLGK